MENDDFQHLNLPMRDDGSRSSFIEWITSPQMLVALSAVLLSVCGLFISIYQTSLMRQQQHASVWPHVEIAPSFSGEDVMMHMQNTGVGPARIRAATVRRGGETIASWRGLVESYGAAYDTVDIYQSLINGRVLRRDSPQERVFAVSGAGEAGRELVQLIRRDITDGRLDVTLCYCSVYDDCWTAGLQDIMRRFRSEQVPERQVDGCDDMEVSGI